MQAADLLTFATAVVILVVGFAALAGFVLRHDRRERLLLWLGLFAAIYGARMFFKQPLAASLGWQPTPARWVESTLDYLILIPALLFAQGLYGPGWRGAFRWITAGIGVYAAGAIVANLVVARPGFAPEPSNALLVAVLLALVIGARAGYKPPPFPEWRTLVAGIVVFLLFVVNEHAVGWGVVPWRFSAEPLGFLLQLAAFGYIAVSRFFSQDRRLVAIDQEMRSAREIQGSILPRRLPAIAGIHLAARYLPVAAVAGDFYDVIALDDGALAILIADVSGHGVPAALIASMVKVAFTSSLADTIDPGAILTRMNRTLCGMFDRSFVTAACVVVSGARRIAHYALGGHPPPLLVRRADGSVTELDERGIFLGFDAAATYTTATLRLESDARLVLYTDGVIEAPGHGGDLFGVERLAALVASTRADTPAAFADHLVRALHRFAGSRDPAYSDRDPAGSMAHDDVTLVVIDIDILGA
jgi:phosphoserine phosphatase RsbU/P